jgi:hypothetical protein
MGYPIGVKREIVRTRLNRSELREIPPAKSGILGGFLFAQRQVGTLAQMAPLSILGRHFVSARPITPKIVIQLSLLLDHATFLTRITLCSWVELSAPFLVFSDSRRVSPCAYDQAA